MAIDPAIVSDRLRELRVRAGLSMAQMARAMGYRGASSYQRYESAERVALLPIPIAEKVAGVLVGRGAPPISRQEVMELSGLPPGEPAAEFSFNPQGITIAETRITPYGVRDLPILGQGRAGDDAYLFENGAEAMSLTYRPAELLSVRDAYAVYVNGDSMSPRFKHGELAYVDPHRPPAPGDDVVIQLRDGQGYIKELVRRTGRAITCRQHNPTGEVEFASDEVRSVHLIILATRVRV